MGPVRVSRTIGVDATGCIVSARDHLCHTDVRIIGWPARLACRKWASTTVFFLVYGGSERF